MPKRLRYSPLTIACDVPRSRRANIATSPATKRPRSGFVAASVLAKRPLFYASYPITPASDILHELSIHKNFGVKTFQAEDEIAAMCAAIGAAFTGQSGIDWHERTRVSL